MGRPENRDERRETIARALIAVMAERGYKGASIQAIAERAELAPGLVHYHFKNKHAVLLAAIEAFSEDHAARLDRFAAAHGPEPMPQVEAFIRAHLDVSAAAPAEVAFWIRAGGEAHSDEAVRAAIATVLIETTDRLEAVLRAGVASGDFAVQDPTAAAASIVAAIHGALAVAATAPTLFPAASAADAVLAMAGGLLASDGEVAQ